MTEHIGETLGDLTVLGSQQPRDRLNSVTRSPNPAKTCPISAAMKPPPMMPSRRGRASNRMIESDVWNRTVDSPGIGGIVGREPAATTILSAVMVRPSTSNVFSAVKRAVPWISSTFGVPFARYSRPPSAIGSIRPNTRSRMPGQSTPPNDVSTPSSGPCLAISAMSAGRTNIFDGIQPTFRHVPPNVPRSTSAIFQSASDSGMALPDPLPMMMRSNESVMRRGNLPGRRKIPRPRASSTSWASRGRITMSMEVHSVLLIG